MHTKSPFLCSTVGGDTSTTGTRELHYTLYSLSYPVWIELQVSTKNTVVNNHSGRPLVAPIVQISYTKFLEYHNWYLASSSCPNIMDKVHKGS
jgi:hypothetical protein